MAEESTASASSRTGEMSLEEKFAVVRSIGEECIQEEELRNLLAKKPNPICYDGFEPSGRMHIAQLNGGSPQTLLSWLVTVSLLFGLNSSINIIAGLGGASLPAQQYR